MTCACLDNIHGAGTFAFILELEVLYARRHTIFVEFATKCS
jgi:hypothetical protein